MSALMDLVAQNQPSFKTHQALLVIGLQNDFVLPDGRLPVNIKKGFLERIQALIPKFRELNGNVIWVQTLYEADRIATGADTGEGDALVVGGLIDGDESSTEGGDEELAKDVKDLPPAQSRSSKHKQRALDLLKRVSARRKTIPQEVAKATAEEDDELFLLKGEKKPPACVPNTFGAEFADVIARQFELPADIVIRTTHYSAFQGTNLLMTLRARLVTELYICGCITNVSVLATVIDAARHGIKINVIEDCLGYRKQTRHDLALKRMDEFFDAYLVNSTEILVKEAPVSPAAKPTSSNGSKRESKGGEQPIDALVSKMSLNDEARPVSRTSNPRSPTKVLSGKQRTLSLVSVAESRKTNGAAAKSSIEPITEPKCEPSDEQFADFLVKGAAIPGSQEPKSEQEKPNLVKTKIRMRSKEKRKKKKDKEKSKDGEPSKDAVETLVANGEASTSTVAPNGTPDLATNILVAKSTPPPTASQRTSLIAKAGSIADLREKESQPQSLKSVASVPVLTSKSEEKERHRLSDLSDRVRLSFSRMPKGEAGTESKSAGGGSSRRTSTVLVKVEDKVTEQRLAKAMEPVETPLVEKPLTKASEPLTRTVPIQPGTVDKVPTNDVEPVLSPVIDQPATTVIDQQAPVRTESTPPTISEKPPAVSKPSKLQSLANFPVLAPGDDIAEGDSRVIHDFFPPHLHHPAETRPLKDTIFTQLRNEVRWQKMMHQQGEVPRLVCCQGAFGEDDGSMPTYRHPTDQTLPLLHFSPKVQVIRKQAEKIVGHPLNHVLIQLYRSGTDYISEHSDKTLDIVKDSSIVNVSFGAQRTMRLRTKRSPAASKDPVDPTSEPAQRSTQRVVMPHNSMFVLGLKSNEKWLHGIMADKRASSERSELETAYGGMRISLTFRHIGTFIDAKERTIWGQGATAKHQRDAADVISADDDESERIIRAFSKENYSADFDWEAHYGDGFDVLHLHAPPEDLPLLFLSNNSVENAQAQICLAEAKIKYTALAAPSLETTTQIMWRDVDTHHTEVEGASTILLYVDKYFPLDTTPHSKPCTAAAYPLLTLAAELADAWGKRDDDVRYQTLLENFEARISESGPYIAGNRFTIADCAIWPLVDEAVRWRGEDNAAEGWMGWNEERFPALTAFHKGTLKKKASVKRVLELGVKERTRLEEGEKATS